MQLLIGILIFIVLFPTLCAIAALMRSSALSQREERHGYQSKILESVEGREGC